MAHPGSTGPGAISGGAAASVDAAALMRFGAEASGIAAGFKAASAAAARFPHFIDVVRDTCCVATMVVGGVAALRDFRRRRRRGNSFHHVRRHQPPSRGGVFISVLLV